MKPINETSIELKWTNPDGIYDFLELNCQLENEKEIQSDGTKDINFNIKQAQTFLYSEKNLDWYYPI